jgi:blue copper oxidase
VAPVPLDPATAVERRKVSLDMIPNHDGMRGMGPMMAINGRVYDMHRIDFTPRLGSTEIWRLTGNRIPHPFHIHGAMFRILSIDGAPPPPHLAGDKDTVLVARPTDILLHFSQPTDRHFPFVFHCHLLEHEQHGMMAQYLTV